MRINTLTFASLVSFLCLIPIAVQAQFFVVPPANTSTNGNSFTGGIFQGEDTTFQIDYSVTQLGSILPGTPLVSIGYRQVGFAGLPSEPVTPDFFSSYQITLSKNNNTISTLSPTFADNIGSDAVTVYDAPLTIPTGAFMSGAGPNPFYDLAFTSPYVYTGGDLLVTLRYKAGTITNQGLLISLDANDRRNDGRGDTVVSLGSSTATTGTAGFFDYPIARFGTRANPGVPEPAPIALFTVSGLTAATFLFRHRRHRPISS